MSRSFSSCFVDFVRYLDVVEPYDFQSGVLDARVGFSSDDDGCLRFWMQDLVFPIHPYDEERYFAVYDRVSRFVRDLNRCSIFVDDRIVRTFDIFDRDGCLCFEEIKGVYHG